MNKIIVEVGSTCTKIDEYDGNTIHRLNEITIQFKKHYAQDHKLNNSDVNLLISEVIKLTNVYDSVFVCGTSIFRILEMNEKELFLYYFKMRTGCDFNIISQEKENELTVLGATRFVNNEQQVCVFIGGGGSTEISICKNDKIIENVNSNIGAIDVIKKFPDLTDDFAKTDILKVEEFIKNKLNLPKGKSDIMILAGGGHQKFAIESGMRYTENSIYSDKNSPIMMDINTRVEDSKNYFEKISLNNIKLKSKDPSWWDATRAMCAFVLVVAKEIGAKYIIPTNIAMAYGIIQELSSKSK